MADRRGRLLVVTSTWPLHARDQRTPFVRDLALDLAGLGWHIRVLAPHAAGAARAEMDGSIEVRRFRYMYPERLQTLAYGAGGLVNLRGGFAKLLSAPFVAAQSLAVKSEIARFRPDVIHAHWLLPQGFTANLAASHAGPPVVTTIHGGDVFALNGALFTPFKRFAASRSAALTANGPLTRDLTLALGAAPEKVRIIRFAPSFVGEIGSEDVRTWRQKFAAEEKIILFVGRLIPEKGPDDFIRAIAQVPARNIRGVIGGDGPMRAELMALAGQLGVADRITFDGWLSPSDIACRMHGADALLFPSKRSAGGWVEAQGIVLVEAMRAGLPVLAAASGGVPDLLEHGRAGWLFPESDIAGMTALIEAAAARRLPQHEAVMKRALEIGTAEITRAATASSFDQLFASLCKAGQVIAG